MVLRLLVGLILLFSGLVWSSDFSEAQRFLAFSQSHNGENFGGAVAQVGNFAVIGAPEYSNGRGRVYIYEYSGSAWVSRAILLPSDPTQYGGFGTSVAMQGDSILVTAQRSVTNNNHGRLYVFAKPASGWKDTTESGSVAAPSSSGLGFGWSIAWSGDNVVVGTRVTRQFSGDGMAFAFRRTAGVFAMVDSILPPVPRAYGYFADAVAMDGNTLAIGERGYTGNPGKAFVYTSAGAGTWSLSTSLQASDGSSSNHFGASVILKNGVLAVGAPQQDGMDGAVYVFENNSSWVQTAKLYFVNNSNYNIWQMGIGEKNGLAFEGNNIIASAQNYDTTNATLQNVGAVMAFTKPNGGWVNDSMPALLRASTPGNADYLGFAIAASPGKLISTSIYRDNLGGNSGYALYFAKPAGGWTNNTESATIQAVSSVQLGWKTAIDGNIAIASMINYEGKGVVNVYEHNGTNWAFKGHLTGSDIIAGNQFGYSIAIEGNTVVVGAKRASANGKSQSGKVYIYEKPSTGWKTMTEIASLTAPDAGANHEFGSDVSIRGNQIAVTAVYGTGAATGSGSVYVFTKTGASWTSATGMEIISTSGIYGGNDGYSVALGDSVLFMGAPKRVVNGQSAAGSVVVFQQSAGNWTEVLRLTQATAVSSAHFGYSLDFADGTLAVGAYGDYAGGIPKGSVTLYEPTISGNWSTLSLIGVMSASGSAINDRIGIDVSMSGQYLVAGAYQDDTQGDNAGALYVWKKPATGWVSADANQKLIGTQVGAGDNFGRGVAVSGPYIVAGAQFHDFRENDMGALWGFHLAPPTTQATNITVSNIHYDSLNIAWTRGNGDSVLVIMQIKNAANPVIQGGQHYADSNWFGMGQSVGNGWYVIYAGPSTTQSMSVYGLKHNTQYRIKVLEYSGEYGLVSYNLSNATGNPAALTTPGISLTSVGIHVAGGYLTNTQTVMEYNIGAGWIPCSADTTRNLLFVPGPVMVRNVGDEGGERIVKTLAHAPAPAYSVNYNNETTQQNIPSSTEYNSNGDFNHSAIKGGGIPVALTPGQNLFLRVAASASALPSLTQQLVVASRPATPSIGINYSAITTNISIPTTMKYSMNANMFGAVSGSNAPLSLTPGTDLYFQVAATTNSFCSAIQHLSIPTIPVAPVLTIDYLDESTQEIVSASMEYYREGGSPQATQFGNQQVLNLNPGQDVYYRIAPSISSFGSAWRTLTVKDRPTNSWTSAINFITEKSKAILNSNYEMDTLSNMAHAQPGTGAVIPLVPGRNVYYRLRATTSQFASLVDSIVVPARPSTPTFSVDFLNKTTKEVFLSSQIVSQSANMSQPVTGQNMLYPVVPDDTLYFQVPATSSAFASIIQQLVIPGKPTLPIIQINYALEQTQIGISSSILWDTQSNFSTAVAGTGDRLAVNPGTDLYFKIPATTSNFSSEVQTLKVGLRPDAPVLSIDFVAETTKETLRNHEEYSLSITMSNAQQGNNQPLNVIPGQNLFTRVRATDSSFASIVSTVIVPKRPNAPSFSIDFHAETTKEGIPSTYRISENLDMSDAVLGSSAPWSINSNDTIYIQALPTSTAFASAIQSLKTPGRPTLQQIAAIDFVKERTQNVLPVHVIYSGNADLSDSVRGNGEYLILVPGESIYFLAHATDSSFCSDVLHLEVPARPSAPQDPKVDNVKRSIGWTPVGGYPNVGAYECSVDFGATWDICASNPLIFSSKSIEAGEIRVRVAASSSNFAGVAMENPDAITTGVERLFKDEILQVIINHRTLKLESNMEIRSLRVINGQGKTLATIQGSSVQLDLNSIPMGRYYLQIQLRDRVISRMIQLSN